MTYGLDGGCNGAVQVEQPDAGVRSTSTELSDPIWFFTLESHFKVLGPIKPLHLRAPLADEPQPDHERDRALSDAYATLTPRYRFRLPN
jgi:hypothetical protein